MSKPTKRLVAGKWRYVFEDGALGMPCAPPTAEERSKIENEDKGRKDEAQANDTGTEMSPPAERLVTGRALASPPQLASPRSGRKVYRVLTQRDEYFKSKFNPEALEEAINALAADGWQVVSMTTTDVGSFWGSLWSKGGGSTRQELIVLLERPASG